MNSRRVANKLYDELTNRQTGLISDEVKKKFAESRILFAGLGASGSAACLLCARVGMMKCTLADPDTVELSNLGRQIYFQDDIGRNKAESATKLVSQVNPSIDIRTITDGITLKNVDRLVRDSDFVVDGIDFTELSIMYSLHAAAYKYQKCVIVPYDLGYLAYLVVYDYSNKKIKICNGKVLESDIQIYQRICREVSDGSKPENELHKYLYRIYLQLIDPTEYPEMLLRALLTEHESIPQLGVTATILASLTTETIRRKLSNMKVREVIKVDLEEVVNQKKMSNPKVKTEMIDMLLS